MNIDYRRKAGRWTSAAGSLLLITIFLAVEVAAPGTQLLRAILAILAGVSGYACVQCTINAARNAVRADTEKLEHHR